MSYLRNLGCILGGKTNMNEMGYGTSGKNFYHNDMPNHKNEEYSGVEGGASLVSSGLLDFAIGSDTIGVSRLAAASNNVVCYRPSINRYPVGDMGFKMAHSMTNLTITTKDMEDLDFLD